MPNYSYKCTACQHPFEQVELIKNRYKPSKKPCPNCGKKKVDMQIGVPSLCDPVNVGTLKPNSGYKECLAKIREKCPKNNMNTRYG